VRQRWLCIGVLAAALAAAGSALGAGGDMISGSTVTIYSSLPRTGASGGQARAIENGAKLALRDRGNKVGRYSVVYKQLDDALASCGCADEGRGRKNAKRAAADATTIGYIGEYNSGISKVSIPILNKAGIAQVSPSNTYVGLTSSEPGSVKDEPAKYYPTGRRTYARVQPNDVIQGGALVTAAREDGCASVDVFDSKTVYSRGMAANIRRAAKAAGLKVRSSRSYDPNAASYRSLAKTTKAPCVIQNGEIESNGVQLLMEVAAAHRKTKLYGADGICLDDTANPKRGGLSAKVGARFKCTIAALDPNAYGPAGRKFFDDYKKAYNIKGNPDPYAIYGYESMALLLDAAQRAADSSGGGGPPPYQSPLLHAAAAGDLTRDAVVNALFATKNRDSVLGTYSIDANGDTTLTDYGLYRISKKRLYFDRVLKAQRPG
jgi:branched-chain amino acid transport system substrate-binding protein